MLAKILREKAGPFAACLSAARDKLSQWRGYGAGGGYAIRFDPIALREHLDTYTPDVQLTAEETGLFGVPIQKRELVKMDYEGAQQIPFISQQLTQYTSQFYMHFTNAMQQQDIPADRYLQSQFEPLLTTMMNLATRLKHHGFEEEKEYRIVTFCPPEFFTPNVIGLIPRVYIDIDPSCIKEVIIGPGQHMDTRESSVRAYFEHYRDRYPGVEVSPSKTPFTGL